MNDSFAIIREQRLALFELNTIIKHAKETYGRELPLDVLNSIAELAKAYSVRYVGQSGKTKADQEYEDICAKNGLPLL